MSTVTRASKRRRRLLESPSSTIPIDTIVKGILPFVSDCRRTCNNVAITCTEAQLATSSMELPWPQDITLFAVNADEDEPLSERNSFGPPHAADLTSNMLIGRRGFVAAKFGWIWRNGSHSRTVVWNCQTGKRHVFRGEGSRYILFSPLHPHILVFKGAGGIFSGELDFWDVERDPPIRRGTLNIPHQVDKFSFAPNGMLACGCRNEISVWSSWNDDVANGGMSCLRRWDLGMDPMVNRVWFSLNNFAFTSNGSDQYVASDSRIFGARNGYFICVWDVSGPASEYPVSRRINGQVEIYSVQSMDLLPSREGDGAYLSSLLEIDDALGERKRYLNVVSVPDGNQVHHVDVTPECLGSSNCLTFSSDGAKVAVCFLSKNDAQGQDTHDDIKIFSTNDYTELSQLTDLGGNVVSMAFIDIKGNTLLVVVRYRSPGLLDDQVTVRLIKV